MKDTHMITHTFTKSVYEKYFHYQDIKLLSLYYDQTGNLGSCSLPFVLWDEYGGKIPQGQNISFVGNAAGGHDIIVNFKQEDSSKKEK